MISGERVSISCVLITLIEFEQGNNIGCCFQKPLGLPTRLSLYTVRRLGEISLAIGRIIGTNMMSHFSTLGSQVSSIYQCAEQPSQSHLLRLMKTRRETSVLPALCNEASSHVSDRLDFQCLDLGCQLKWCRAMSECLESSLRRFWRKPRKTRNQHWCLRLRHTTASTIHLSCPRGSHQTQQILLLHNQWSLIRGNPPHIRRLFISRSTRQP